ncbi:MAG: hypothetical protein ACPKPY_08900, partial [Nitrososphaeraceae archaeon]
LMAQLEKLTESLSLHIQREEEQTNQIKNQLRNKRKKISEDWLDTQQVCEALRVSKRTMQNYRDNLILAYSQIGVKSTIVLPTSKNFNRSKKGRDVRYSVETE